MRNQIYQQVHTIGALLNENSVSLVTEAYNLAEGQSEAAFLRAVEAITKMAEHTKSVEILVMDPSEKNIVANILKRHFPQVKSLHVPGQSCEPPRFYARLPLGHRVATVKKVFVSPSAYRRSLTVRFADLVVRFL
jgi:hypothetical protein